MSKKDAINKLDTLIGFFENYNKMLLNMEVNIEKELSEVQLAA